MESLNIKLDKSHYKGLVLGTGMYESLLSAALAYKSYSSINFDLDTSYSAAIKTCSIKEYIQLFTSVYPANKNHIFRVMDYQTTIQDEEKGKLRGFNIDLQPRFLYSSSLTVNKMIEAGMDKYMDFRAISGVFFFDEDSSKFVKMPVNKGEIFASGALSILEKRKLFKFLHTCTSISKVLSNSEIDINSTSDFDKDLKIDDDLMKDIVAIKNEHFLKFLDLMGISGKLANLLLFVIANYNFNIEDSKEKEHFLTTQDFITRIEKFIKSMGIHSNYPYLYTNYGTSDVPQGFSRASAVNASIFILNPQLDLKKIAFSSGEDSEGNKYSARLKTEMVGEKEHLTSEVAVLNKDYLNLIDGFEDKEIQLETKALLRVTLIVEDVERNFDMETPSFYYVFPQSKTIGNSSPMFIFATGEKSSSCPENFYIFYVQTVVNSNETQENLKTLENNIAQFLKEKLCNNSQYKEVIRASYLQSRRKTPEDLTKVLSERAVIIDDDDFALDFDDYFTKCEEYMKKLVPENQDLLFYHNGDQKGTPGFAAPQDEDEDYQSGSHLKGLLDTLDKFKVENKEKKEGEEKTDIPEAKKEEEEESTKNEEVETKEVSEVQEKTEKNEPAENQEETENIETNQTNENKEESA